MEMNIKQDAVWVGTAGGTFFPTLGLIRIEDIIITIILASIGAVVSFLLSCLLNLFLKPRFGKKKRKK
tara:strand:- start:1274 stop:1477 length:204 start_codon:yes stop_codon:yes gene_type:complete